jgi:hypothetical protein
MNSEQKASYELLRDIGELSGELKALRAENKRLIQQNAQLIALFNPTAAINTTGFIDPRPDFGGGGATHG